MRRGARMKLNSIVIPIVVWAGAFAMSTGVTSAADIATDAALRAQAAKSFQQADRDGDQRLSLEEFVQCQPQPEVARRDFQIFDFDASRLLTRDEFFSCPTVLPPHLRGPMFDPLSRLVDEAVVALDEALGGWNLRPNEELDRNAVLAVINGSTVNPAFEFNLLNGGRAGAATISRAEAREHLEFHLGVRRRDGELLRKPDGRVVNYMLYSYIDLNHNDALDRQEFRERSYAGIEADREFDAADADRNHELSFLEYCSIPSRGHEDPIEQFRWFDKNLDAFVDPGELKAGLPDWKQPIGTTVFPGFDLDADGRLSLAEYRMTLPANMVIQWQQIAIDQNQDEQISLEEFRSTSVKMPLLQLYYFHRMDLNRDGFLAPPEYPVPVKTRDEFFSLNADGSDWRSLYVFDGYNACGSVAISPDGKWLAFDAWSTKPRRGSAMFVMPMSGGEPVRLGDGMMPNWSPDSRQLTFSSGSSLWMTSRNGEERTQLAQGWGAQWSPDGRRIAFARNAEVCAYNLETKLVETLLTAEENLFQSVYWNMGWSPDSRRLCFKGAKADGSQGVAVMDAVPGKPNLKVRYLGKVAVNADFAWHPRGDRIVFAMQCPERSRVQLYEFDPDADEPPRLFPGQPVDRNLSDCCWTPDGKRLIVISGDY